MTSAPGIRHRYLLRICTVHGVHSPLRVWHVTGGARVAVCTCCWRTICSRSGGPWELV